MTGTSSNVAPNTALARRVERLQVLLRPDGGCAVFGLGPNLTYFTGFAESPQERLFLWVVPPDGPSWWLVPQLYEHEVMRLARAEHVIVWHDSQGHEQALARLVERALAAGARRFLLDDWLTAPAVLAFQQAVERRQGQAASQPGALGGQAWQGVRLYGLVRPIASQLRAVKGPDEVEAIRAASAIADRVFEQLVRRRFSGETEKGLARRIEELAVAAGADGMFFPPIVASGPNSALPHHRPTIRTIQPGDVVILDFGCRVGQYGSDITRTVVCGGADPEVQRVYEVVRQAQEAGVSTSGPGVACEAVDEAARTVIERAGFGQYFTHRTGHSIGLETHEPPFLVKGDRTPLAPGMVHSVEPGVYLLGRFGIRIEDLVLVEPGGARRLNEAPRDLVVVD